MIPIWIVKKFQNPKVIYSIPQKVKFQASIYKANFQGLVLWLFGKLGQAKSKKSTTVISHLNNEMCRIFRHFLDDNDDYGTRRNIKVQVVNPEGKLGEPLVLKANDPLYLLTQIIVQIILIKRPT